MKLKYKVWDKAKKKMFYWGTDFAYITERGIVLLNNGGMILPPNVETLVYSGVTDESDKEICEGDTIIAIHILGQGWMVQDNLKNGSLYKGTVVFQDGSFCLKIIKTPDIKGVVDQYDIGSTPELNNFMWMKIEGNIYENSK